MRDWITVIILALSTAATALSWWEGRVRRRTTRDVQQSSDHVDHGQRIKDLETCVEEIRDQVRDVAGDYGRLKVEAAMRDEHAKEYRDRADREFVRLWNAVQRRHPH